MSRIYSTSKPLPVGRIVQPEEIGVAYMTDDDGINHKPQPFYVIRKATREEYLAQYIGDDDKTKRNLLASKNPANYFYEVHMD